MKNVIVRGLYCVGMHHWGGRELAVGPVYYLKHEPENPRDINAIAVYQDREYEEKRCYHHRPDSFVISKLFRQNLVQGPCYLKAKGPVERWHRHTGPEQKCNLGFRRSNHEQVINQIKGKDYGLEIVIF